MAAYLDILLVDDEINMLEVLKDVLAAEGHAVTAVGSGQEAIEVLTEHPAMDLVITDLRMPKMDGLALLEAVKGQWAHLPVVILTGYGTVEGAVEAIKKGAYDYILKPFKPDEIHGLIGRIVERKGLVEDNIYFQQELSRVYGFEQILGNSPGMQAVFDAVETVSLTDSSVVLSGESGTGKELLAHVIHYASRRKGKRFIKVNCAAFAEGVLESELFGHEKGAFTTAVSRRIGRFELADGGTLFLDEIGDIPISTQVKLLRVLQTREFERVGGSETIKVDVRLISATNQHLEEKIRLGTFREDFFYRLNVVPVHIPPLRERREDIPVLATFFLQEFARDTHRRIEGISTKAMDLLLAYSWPGNVRELRNYIERAVVFCQTGTIEPHDLPQLLREGGDRRGITLRLESKSLYEMEKRLILLVLDEADWNLTRAADQLRISRGTLYSKMKKYRISPPV